jgi:heme exporter protein B
LPERSAGLTAKIFAVYSKDIRMELRSRYAVNAILMFGITTLAMVSFSLGQAGLPPAVLSALFWIIMFFSATAGLSLVFVREEESGTALALRLAADPTAVYLGKLFFNFTLLALMTLIITPVFFMFTDAPTDHLGPFIIVEVLGVIGLCGATTLVAAIISRAAIKGALFAVLSFPILITLLLMLVIAGTKILDGKGLGELVPEIQGLIAYSVVMITASLLLFKFVWQD